MLQASSMLNNISIEFFKQTGYDGLYQQTCFTTFAVWRMSKLSWFILFGTSCDWQFWSEGCKACIATLRELATRISCNLIVDIHAISTDQLRYYWSGSTHMMQATRKVPMHGTDIPLPAALAGAAGAQLETWSLGDPDARAWGPVVGKQSDASISVGVRSLSCASHGVKDPLLIGNNCW